MLKLKSVPLSFGVLLYTCASLAWAQGTTSSASPTPTMAASAAFVTHAWRDGDLVAKHASGD